MARSDQPTKECTRARFPKELSRSMTLGQRLKSTWIQELLAIWLCLERIRDRPRESGHEGLSDGNSPITRSQGATAKLSTSTWCGLSKRRIKPTEAAGETESQRARELGSPRGGRDGRDGRTLSFSRVILLPCVVTARSSRLVVAVVERRRVTKLCDFRYWDQPKKNGTGEGTVARHQVGLGGHDR